MTELTRGRRATPGVSIIVTSYNRPDLLAKTLLSLSLQSTLPDEVVIADDGSSVDIPAALAPLVSQLPFRLVFVTQADQGFRAARNRNNGAREASCPYMAFVDQDVVSTRDYLGHLAAARRTGTFQCGSVIRLTEEQTARVSEATIRDGLLDGLVTDEQRAQMAKVHRKKRSYELFYKLKLRRDRGPKLLSGAFFGVWKEDYLAVNGFDEQYQGWGNEDDDLGRRLHRNGCPAIHVHNESQYLLHLHHPANNAQGRTNEAYYRQRVKEIRAGDVAGRYGIKTPLGDDTPQVTVLKEGP